MIDFVSSLKTSITPVTHNRLKRQKNSTEFRYTIFYPFL